ncbi:hypothetical protein NBH00_22295 [Paraconexibacter antarcticus]|uniref:WD40 repeat protein n=1 Tax=Paraconexibacter antarcticus TaxID=2949664 RepID=A0ABY5DR20_9ACTN|nr:hypothetical protein [Paraconexibacter antarcticus]UTI64054.1 hypothetical protein NBH00_22295 [Paraconexibacter antarcticus]
MPRRRLTGFVAAAALAGAGAVGAPVADAATARDGSLALATGGQFVLQPVGGGSARRAAGPGVSIVGTSRGGGLVALSSGAGGDVTITTPGGRVIRRFAFGGIVVHSLDISPDGRTLALTAFRNAEPYPGHLFPYLARVDGRDLRRLRTRTRFVYDLRFTPDGGSLVYAGAPSAGTQVGCASLRRVRADGAADAAVYPAGRTPGRPCVVTLALSPGGDGAAFTGDPDPARPSPDGAVRTAAYRVRLSGPSIPALVQRAAYAVAWAPGGGRIAFSTPAGTFYAASSGTPRPVLVSPLSTLSLAWLRRAG